MGMDSLDMVSLVMELEELFDLDISDEEAGKLLSLADLIRWIRERERGEPDLFCTAERSAPCCRGTCSSKIAAVVM